jgi:uncharacterized protein
MLANLPVIELALLALALIGAGAVTGILAGLFGVGGGAVMVPVLYQVYGFVGVPQDIQMHLAIGTSLTVIMATSMRSFRGHLAKGAVDLDLLKTWAIPVVLGVLAGSFIAASVNSSVLKGIFAVIAFLNGIKLLAGKDHWRLANELPSKGILRIYGVIMGVLSALMGIGGGVFGSMIMTLYGRTIHQAVATSSGLGVLISAPGMIGYMTAGWPQIERLPPFSIGFVSLIGVALLIPMSTWLAPIGVRLAHGFRKRTLEKAFGAFLMIIGIRFGMSFWIG